MQIQEIETLGHVAPLDVDDEDGLDLDMNDDELDFDDFMDDEFETDDELMHMQPGTPTWRRIEMAREMDSLKAMLADFDDYSDADFADSAWV